MKSVFVLPCSIGDTIIEEYAGKFFRHVVSGFKLSSGNLYLLYEEEGYTLQILASRAIINEGKMEENNGQKKDNGADAENMGRGRSVPQGSGRC